MTKKRSTDIRTCPVCGHQVQRSDMQFTRDCNGIPFRLVCWDCYDQLMAKGYDGEYYTEADEKYGICKCGIGRTDGKMQKMHSLHILSMGRIVQRIEAETGCKPRPVTMAT